MNTEVENYFRAIVETCNHEGWKHIRIPGIAGI